MSRLLKLAITGAVLLGLGLLMVPVLMTMAVLESSTVKHADQGKSFRLSSCAVSASGTEIADLDRDQVADARTIIAVGKSLKVPPRG